MRGSCLEVKLLGERSVTNGATLSSFKDHETGEEMNH